MVFKYNNPVTMGEIICNNGLYIAILMITNDIIIPKETVQLLFSIKLALSYDVVSGSKTTPCNKIDKPLVVYRFTGNVMTSITMLRS